jgi:hypothetical protein
VTGGAVCSARCGPLSEAGFILLPLGPLGPQNHIILPYHPQRSRSPSPTFVKFSSRRETLLVATRAALGRGRGGSSDPRPTTGRCQQRPDRANLGSLATRHVLVWQPTPNRRRPLLGPSTPPYSCSFISTPWLSAGAVASLRPSPRRNENGPFIRNEPLKPSPPNSEQEREGKVVSVGLGVSQAESTATVACHDDEAGRDDGRDACK